MKILTFGDSWAAGHGLGIGEKNFTDFLSESLRCENKNFGMSGASLGHILHDFTQQIRLIKENDLVIIIIPPDVRWYTQAEDKRFTTLFLGDKKYKNFVKDKSKYWFKYHHSLFIYTMYNICKELRCNFLFAHNYGMLEIIEPFASIIPDKVFLDKHNSLTTLLGGADYNNYDLRYDGPPEYIIGENFISEDTHPNEKGHKIIADLLLDKYNEKL